ncbi:cyclic nucleotide-binding domain-containing protein [Chloroflexota bacterium]
MKRCEVFLGLDDTDLLKIAELSSCQEESYQSQEIIMTAGTEARKFYLVEEGQINLVLRETDSPFPLPEQTVVRTVTKGGTFGWSALVPPHVRILGAVAKTSCKVLSIGGGELRHLFDQEPRLGYEVTKDLLKVIAWRFMNIEQLLVTGKGSLFFDK